jgi:hypothetical protein
MDSPKCGIGVSNPFGAYLPLQYCVLKSQLSYHLVMPNVERTCCFRLNYKPETPRGIAGGGGSFNDVLGRDSTRRLPE